MSLGRPFEDGELIGKTTPAGRSTTQTAAHDQCRYLGGVRGQLLPGQAGVLAPGGFQGCLGEPVSAQDPAVTQPGLEPLPARPTEGGRGLIAGQEDDRACIGEVQGPFQAGEDAGQLGAEPVDGAGAVGDQVHATAGEDLEGGVRAVRVRRWRRVGTAAGGRSRRSRRSGGGSYLRRRRPISWPCGASVRCGADACHGRPRCRFPTQRSFAIPHWQPSRREAPGGQSVRATNGRAF